MKRVLFVTVAALSGCSSAETVVAPPSAPVRRQPPTASTEKFALARFESPSPAGSGESGTNAAPSTVPPTASRQQSCSGWPRGTAVAVEETTRGAAMVFTSSDDISALRARVADQRDTPTAEYSVHLDNVRRGIRVVYEPTSGDKDKLREAIEIRARSLSRACELSWGTPEEEPTETPSRTATTPLQEATGPWLTVEGEKIEAKDSATGAAKADDKDDETADDDKADDKKADDKKPGDKKPEEKKPEDDKKPDDKKPDDKKPGDKKPDEDKPAPPGDKPKDDEKPKEPFPTPAPKP